MEDLDTPRIVPGASSRILQTLGAFGFEWDGELVHQSDRLNRYVAALDALTATGKNLRVLVQPCAAGR